MYRTYRRRVSSPVAESCHRQWRRVVVELTIRSGSHGHRALLAKGRQDDDVLYISPNFSDDGSVFNDIIHEIAHHIETLYPGFIYDDGKIVHEFLKKRHEVEFELKTEGYWTEGYDFEDINYNEQLDHFLYKKVGPNMLRLVTTGSFIRPYAAVSVREYFATGFEAYYLGQKEKLDKISPMLYDKIYEMHHQENLT